jgi:hypothetical protein
VNGAQRGLNIGAGGLNAGGVKRRRGTDETDASERTALLPATRGPIVNRALWTLQALVSFLFLFGGSAKLAMPMDELAAQTGLPSFLLLFVSVAEVAGGLGLILPGLLRIKVGLTPLAAAGLTLIMVGAVVLGLMSGDVVATLFPLVTGLLTATIAYIRYLVLPHGRPGPVRRRPLAQAAIA